MPNGLPWSIFQRMTDIALRSDEILVTLNGEVRRLRAGVTIAGLLQSLELDPRMVVVEQNRTILRDRAVYSSLALNEGDTLEIVHFVGGG